MDAAPFLSALAAIVVIDVVLAGDNAIVIALAARRLPERLQKRAIVWGALGAIGVRGVMTAAVVWLLALPGLLLAGGLMLLWIAWRLLRTAPGEGAAHGGAAGTSFWGAMRTIVVADAVMGLDNVLAVAGAAHGSYLLVVLGLLISVPLVMWGSTLVLGLVRRHPGIVYLGAGVLVWTAAKMMLGEPLLAPWLEASPVLKAPAYALIPLLLWAGFAANHRRAAARIQAHLDAPSRRERRRQHRRNAARLRVLSPTEEGPTMPTKILIPTDGSANALQAVRHAIVEHRRGGELEAHLLNVQPRLPAHITRFVARRDRDAWLRDRAVAATAAASALLARHGVPHRTHWAAGDRAAEICAAAERLGVHHIVMGIARKNSLTRMFEDSVTEQVLEATPVPVELVVGSAVSAWERWGLPVGVLAAGGGLLMAVLD